MIAAALLARSGGVGDARWSPSGARLAWTVAHDGRADIVVAPADGMAPPVVVSAETGVGGGYAWASDDELVVGAADGRLVVLGANGARLRTLTHEGCALAPAVSTRGDVACAIERDDACDIAVVPLDGTEWPVRVSYADYAWDAAWSPDGTRLAWHEWDLPDMPWDASRIMLRRDGGTKVVAGGDGVSVGQPRFAPTNDRLAFVSDSEGWSAVWTADADGGATRPLLREEHEHAEPAWGPGQRSFAWSPDATHVAWCRNEDGFGRLVIASTDARSARDLSKGWHRALDWHARGIVAIRSGAVTPPQVVVFAANGSGRRAVAQGAVAGFDATPLVEPRPVSWKSGSATVHGLRYRPRDDVNRPPLLVHIHGGPTGEALADWNPRVQWFVQRGFVVLQPNHRGSTGHGRAYTQALAGRWGERDVDDVVAGIRHAVKEGWADGGRVVLMGGSAGGFTALNVAARHPDLVHAVIGLYPVTDLLDLAATTHRFESGYHLRLVGPLPERAAGYRERSPITVAGDIRVPVLLLHGDADRSVRPEQSAALATALRSPVERHVYEGEGHGWKRGQTVADELARIDAFLTRWLAS